MNWATPWFLMLAPLASLASAAQSADLMEIVHSAIRNYQNDQNAALRYSFTEVDDDKSKGVEISHVTTIEGTPYERVISRHGKPLAGEDEEKERRKFEKTVAERSHESAEERQQRIRKYREEADFLDEAPEAFEFRMLPGESLAGYETYVVECVSKPGFQPRSLRGKMFTKLVAKAWVDKQSLRIVKIEADTTGTVSIGLIMARVGKGAHMELEQTRLEDGTWVLKRLAIDGRAQIMLVDPKRWDESVTYQDYRVGQPQR